MLGAERLVYGQLGDDALHRCASTRRCRTPKVGDVVACRATPEHVHWFDAATSVRVGA